MSVPIVVDIDGTMSRADRSIPGAVIDRLHGWEAQAVIATGKAFPYPVALCDFIGIATCVIAENGGVCCVDDHVIVTDDGDEVDRFITGLEARGYGPGWGESDLVNRWRESEVAVTRSIPREIVDEVAGEVGLEVVDSQFAYHVKSPGVSKGNGLKLIADHLGIPIDRFVAIGDSENDLSTFSVAGGSIAVANADAELQAVADQVTDEAYAEGLLEALDLIQSGFPDGR